MNFICNLNVHSCRFFEFRVCPFAIATQECFEENQLTIFSDNDPNQRLQFNPDRALGKMFTLYGILPKGKVAQFHFHF